MTHLQSGKAFLLYFLLYSHVADRALALLRFVRVACFACRHTIEQQQKNDVI